MFLGGGFIFFNLFSPLLGEMIQFDYIVYISDGLKPPTRFCFAEDTRTACFYHRLYDRTCV